MSPGWAVQGRDVSYTPRNGGTDSAEHRAHSAAGASPASHSQGQRSLRARGCCDCCSSVGNAFAGISLFLFLSVKLKEKLSLGSGFVYPVFPSFFFHLFIIYFFVPSLP